MKKSPLTYIFICVLILVTINFIVIHFQRPRKINPAAINPPNELNKPHAQPTPPPLPTPAVLAVTPKEEYHREAKAVFTPSPTPSPPDNLLERKTSARLFAYFFKENKQVLKLDLFFDLNFDKASKFVKFVRQCRAKRKSGKTCMGEIRFEKGGSENSSANSQHYAGFAFASQTEFGDKTVIEVKSSSENSGDLVSRPDLLGGLTEVPQKSIPVDYGQIMFTIISAEGDDEQEQISKLREIYH